MTVQRLGAATLMLALTTWPQSSGAQAPAATVTIDIHEWAVPWEDSRPRDPYVDAQGRVWFVGQRGHYVAYLEPDTGEFKKFDLEPGTGPHNLIVDKEGFVWYSGNLAAHIGRVNPKTGAITKFPMPNPGARDPHTLVFDQSGDIWFTTQGGNFVGRLDTPSGKVELTRVPTERARPYGIVVNSKNEPWLVEFGSNKLATVDMKTMAVKEVELPRTEARPLATVDMKTMAVKEVELPRTEARPRRLAVDSKDRVWYVDYATGMLGRYDPATSEFKEWPTPGGAKSQPYGMAIDAQDRIWFVESGPQPNRFVGFDAGAERFFSVTEIPSGGGTVRHMYFHEPTGEIWFGTDTNRIGRARLPRRES